MTLLSGPNVTPSQSPENNPGLINTSEKNPDPVNTSEKKFSTKSKIIAVLAALGLAGGGYAITKAGGSSEPDRAPSVPSNNAESFSQTTDPVNLETGTITIPSSEAQASENSQSSAEQTSEMSEVVNEVSPEATINTDGSVSFSVEAFKDSPKALGEAFINDGLNSWITAGNTLPDVRKLLDGNNDEDNDGKIDENNPALDAQSIALSKINAKKFESSMLVQNWQSNPNLVDFADAIQKVNADSTYKFAKTASNKNTGDNSVVVEGHGGGDAYKTEIKAVNVQASTDQSGIKMTIEFEQTDNVPDTNLNGNYSQINNSGTMDVLFVEDGGTYKLADASIS